MPTLWLIAARSQSKSIPHKNVRPLGDHPLLAWRVAAARGIAPAVQVWISTDSEEYARIAASFGATVPFLRPPELASDSARSVDVVAHALEHAQRSGIEFDLVALLEPTSPFVLPSSLLAAEARLRSELDADAVVATRRVRPSTYFVQPEARFLDELARRIGRHGALRRQEEQAEVTPSGGFYIARCEPFLRARSFYTPRTLSHPVGDLEGLEIDEPIDWDWAEFLVSTGRVRFPG